uniref:OVO protein n=1 Tax=Bombyx mori TaxID=7091 RepID=I1W5G9_BOMMO|nr:OVO protein [Bombyx mori]
MSSNWTAGSQDCSPARLTRSVPILRLTMAPYRSDEGCVRAVSKNIRTTKSVFYGRRDSKLVCVESRPAASARTITGPQRCSLESHCLKVHGVQHTYAYKERRTKMYVCEECGHTTSEPEEHYMHLKKQHPYSPALLKFYDKRHFKFTNAAFANQLLGQLPMPVHN